MLPNKHECVTCIHSRGEVANHMIYCSKIEKYRATGIRICVHYEPKRKRRDVR